MIDPKELEGALKNLTTGTLRELFRILHENGDLDFNDRAHHHSLGQRPYEAAKGNHKHDGVYSAVTHDHSATYSPLGHSHSGYAPAASHKARRTETTQTLTTGVDTDQVLTTVDYDDFGLFSSSTTITIKRAGVARVVAGGSFASNVTGRRQLQIKRNGVVVAGAAIPTTYAGQLAISAVWEGPVSVGTTFTSNVFQNSGANLDFSRGFMVVSEVF